MNKLTSKQVRQMWLDFFESKGHLVVPSKSLIPIKDPSLLWINSGVATLKDYFSGKKQPPKNMLTSSQKSIRTNDIENVGVTARHHTLFEMLGNFSIGDYFKSEVLEFAMELLFDVYKLDKEKVYMTYFEDDKETYDGWVKLGIDPSHLIPGDRDMNFWDVGEGPCGPDTEIFYDRGEKYDPKKIGIKLLKEDLENDRYVEIWNIVFSQFNNDGENNYVELAQKNIDTGAGLERMVSIFQDAPTNFDTDLFLPIIKEVEKLTGEKYSIENYFNKDPKQTKINKHFRIIADHIRAVSLAIEDGAKPSNISRGYIIRRLIRRAYRSALQLGANGETFLYKLVPVVAKVLDVYPINIKEVQAIITKEELSFAKTIKEGEELLKKELKSTNKEFDAEVAFKLFETYGFPIELTQEILEEKNISLDITKIEKARAKHVAASKGKKSVKAMEGQIQVIQEITEKKSEFTGYTSSKENASVIFQGEEKGKFYILLNKTPLYATGGGQAGDKGTIDGVLVEDVFKDKFGNYWHITNKKIEKTNVEACVDSINRLNAERNHSATHLLGNALRQVFGNTVVQLGSDNNADRLRFDFPLDERPSEDKLKKVEKLVNESIDKDLKREYIETSFDEGIKMGAITLEGEDYGDDVRVVVMGDIIEFCGGTHIKSTSQIESFKITKFESKGSGIFRIEAITSNDRVLQFNQEELSKLKEELELIINRNKKIESSYKLKFENTLEGITDAIAIAKIDNKKLNKKSKDISIDISEFTPKEIDGVLTIKEEVSPNLIKPLAIKLRESYQEALIILLSPQAGLVAVASNKYDSAKKAKEIFPNFKGGGNEKFAMGKVE